MFLSVWKCNTAGASKAWPRDVRCHHEDTAAEGLRPASAQQQAAKGSGTCNAHTQIPKKEGKLNSTPNGQGEHSTSTCMPLLGGRRPGREAGVTRVHSARLGSPLGNCPRGVTQPLSLRLFSSESRKNTNLYPLGLSLESLVMVHLISSAQCRGATTEPRTGVHALPRLGGPKREIVLEGPRAPPLHWPPSRRSPIL